ncbi:MAG: DUF420 domain-containing protein [Planctomycetota bacterium]|nr:MAG: DUF420 domain-containing protein [Planctomycetota bacterium]
MEVSDLPTVNAILNGLACSLLIAGLAFIRKGREGAHKSAMVAAFACSVAFLASYLYYHAHAGRISFRGEGFARSAYLILLGSHTILAALVPFMAIRTLWLGFADRRSSHRRWARWTFPIWVYVSITGVLIYLVLYHFTDSARLAGRG